MNFKDLKFILILVVIGAFSFCFAMIPELLTYGIYNFISPATETGQITLLIALLLIGMPLFVVSGVMGIYLFGMLVEAVFR